MKKYYLVLVLYLCIVHVFSQSRTDQLNKQLTFKTWVDGETREINGYLVCRIHGADFGNHRNAPTGMITSVAYHDAESKDQMSFLEFYITRYEQSLANMKWFTIIIRGEDDDKKIFEKRLDYKAAQLPEGSYFWNYTTVPISDTLGLPFYVYIKDQNLPDLTSFKFKIEK
jgi:hypothetical protein